MAKVNVTPVMTSNTTPTPYIISASSVNASYLPWKAFNATNLSKSDCWISGNMAPTESSPHWIQIDFSTNTKVNSVEITQRNGDSSGGAYPPSKIILTGSDDNTAWEIIKEYDTPTWENNETILFEFNSKNYRYYRIAVPKTINTSSNLISFGNITFYYDSELDVQIPPIPHKNTSLVYTLPMNTTQKIKSKTNDSRVGLLGMANDNENFGDLYVVGKDGKSHLTKSGIKTEVIFEGMATQIGSYTLKEDISKFNFLCVVTGNFSFMIYVDHRTSLMHLHSVEAFNSRVYIYYNLSFLNNVMSIVTVENATWKADIRKIIGIY